MKTSILLSLLTLVLTTSAFAKGGTEIGSSQIEKANAKAFALLLQNSARLTDQDGRKVSEVLALSLSTFGRTHNKVSNSCAVDKGDQALKCTLSINNSDDDKSAGGTESMTEINYQLDIDAQGNPTDFTFLTVEVTIAG